MILLLPGCRAILMQMYGIKNPGIENETSIKKAALKWHLDTANIVTLNSADFLPAYKSQSLPDAAIFDSSGDYIEYRATDTSCNAGLFSFIPALAVNNTYRRTHKTTQAAELKKFRNLKGHDIKPLPPADFYVLIYWAAWIGRLNKDHVKVWEDQARQNKNCSVAVIKVNLDLQESWDEAERNRIISAISKKK